MEKIEYELDIVKFDNKYVLFDFTITRPKIYESDDANDIVNIARGYKLGINSMSYSKFNPVINNEETILNETEYIESKKKYYKEKWSKKI